MSEPRSWILFATTVVSHLAMLPTAQLFFKRSYVYEATIAAFGILFSFMYHTCQSFNTVIFLEELQWHHLDNISAIAAVGMWCVFICCFRNAVLERGVKYCTLLVSVVIQEKDPWNVAYSIVPISLFIMLPVGIYLFRRQAPAFHYRYFCSATVLMGTATFFFFLGLDDELDPYRIYHGLWHLLGGIASYFLWVMVKLPGLTGAHLKYDPIIFREDTLL